MHGILYFFLIAGMALPAFAQREKLIGTWEHIGASDEEGPQLTTHVEFRDNGEFTLSFASTLSAEEFLGGGESEGEEPKDEGAELSAQVFAELFPDTLSISITATGTWEADDQSLRLDATASQVRLNGLDPQEFFIQLAEEMARRMAEAFEITEADYSAFEQEITENVLSGAGAGVGEFSPDELDLVGTYAFGDNGVLLLTDEDGEITQWRNMLVSAVETLSWGQVKGARPSALRR
ncbi:MAG: hypothetical protein HYW07_17110 [Candidatus Latescibacteria bacterium]|nr:hypothetical protein [Candidatus Latescibacterota bacterium]